MLMKKIARIIVSGIMLGLIPSLDSRAAEMSETPSLGEEDLSRVHTNIKSLEAEIDEYNPLIGYLQGEPKFQEVSMPSIESVQKQRLKFLESAGWIKETSDYLWNHYHQEELDIERYTARSLRDDLWKLNKKIETFANLTAPYLPEPGNITPLILIQRLVKLDCIKEKLAGSIIELEINKYQDLIYYLGGREHECSEEFLKRAQEDGYIERHIKMAQSTFSERLEWCGELRKILEETITPTFYARRHVPLKYWVYFSWKEEELQKAWNQSALEISSLYVKLDSLEKKLKID